MGMSIRRAAAGVAAALGLAALHAAAPAATLPLGLYRLNNHPDGALRPPLYGARFDELFNLTAGRDSFTLDFDDVQSAAFMTVSASQIRIFGQSLGGRDDGVSLTHVNDQYLGIYTFDMTYSLGVADVPGDDDKWSTADGGNTGFLTAPNGLGTALLSDKKLGDYSFRIGDEDNEGGHRGFDGISGWGWMNYVTPSGVRYEESTDWIFKATYVIPSPGAIGLAGVGLVVLLRRRRV